MICTNNNFGTEPPADVWHTSKQRFANINFQRVNLSRYWLIRKPRVSMQNIVAVLSIISVVIFVQASELTIIPVILLLVVLCAFAITVGSDDKNKKGDDGNGCSSSCGGEGAGLWDFSHNNSDSSHHAGDSGCSSGCSSSGCSGCGGD